MLSDPEFLQRAAECYAEGLNREDMCEILGVRDVKTISKWRRDPRIKDAVRKILQDRVQRVIAKTDAEIARRLTNPGDMTMKELLEVRKEFLGGQLRDATTEMDENTVNAASGALEENPEFAEQLAALFDNSPKPDTA